MGLIFIGSVGGVRDNGSNQVLINKAVGIYGGSVGSVRDNGSNEICEDLLEGKSGASSRGNSSSNSAY